MLDVMSDDSLFMISLSDPYFTRFVDLALAEGARLVTLEDPAISPFNEVWTRNGFVEDGSDVTFVDVDNEDDADDDGSNGADDVSGMLKGMRGLMRSSLRVGLEPWF